MDESNQKKKLSKKRSKGKLRNLEDEENRKDEKSESNKIDQPSLQNSTKNNSLKDSETKLLLVRCYICPNYLDEKKYCINCCNKIRDENNSLLFAKIQKLEQLKKQNQLLKDTIHQTIQNKAISIQKNILKEKLKKRVQILQEKIGGIDHQTITIKQKMEKLKEKNRIQNNLNNFLSARFTEKTIEIEKKYPPLIKKNEKEIRIIYEKLAQHRRYLITELLSFFSLNPYQDDDTKYIIVNLKIPSCYTDWKDMPAEVIAASLGYLVQLIRVSSCYLDVWLPYKLHFFGSRSEIWIEEKNISFTIKTRKIFELHQKC